MIRIFQILIFIMFFSCNQTENSEVEAKEENVDWIIFDDEKYSFEYPKDWKLNDSKQMGIEFFIMSQLSNENDNFSENVNLVVQDLSKNSITLDEYISASEKQILNLVTDVDILDNARKKNSRGDYHIFTYNGIQGIHKLTIEQYIWVKNEKAYVLTFTCKRDEFDKYKSVGERILKSFKIN